MSGHTGSAARRALGAGFVLLLAAGAISAAKAPRARPGDLPVYAAECGSCHVAYAPRFLPPASWRRIVGGLERHYGVDATLDAGQTAPILPWLVANASRRAAEPPEDRISRQPWFRHEHGRIDAATWQRPAIGSASRCEACHTRASQGAFRERDIHIPR